MTFTNTRKDYVMRSTLNRAAASMIMAFAAGMPALGQQTQIAVRPGSGVVRTRDRGYRHTPRVLDEAARAKHAAKMQRRYLRWAWGEKFNPCISVERLQSRLRVDLGRHA